MHAHRPPEGIAVLPSPHGHRAALVVIAQVPHHAGHRGPIGLGEEAAARLEPRLGPVARRRVLERLAEVEAAAVRRPPAARLRIRLDAGRRLVPVVLDGGAVRDGGALAHAARHPVPARGLEHPGLARVGDDERVVIAPRLPVARIAALAVTLQQRGDDLFRLGRRAAALEAEPHQVHAEQARCLGLLAGMQRLVADHDPVFVHPVLEAPEPPRPAAEHRERLVHLGNVEVLAAQEGLRRVREARGAEERLALVGRPVAVLREQRVAVAGVRPEDDEGVAARVEHRRPRARAHLPARRFAGRRTARFAARAAGFFSSSSSFRTSISATIPWTSVRAPVWK